MLAIHQPLSAFKLSFLNSNLWLPSSFACKTSAFDCLYSSLWLSSSSFCYTAAFGCLQALLAIQQPLSAFKLCFLYSSLRLSSSLLAIQQSLAAFKLRLLNIGLLLPSIFASYTAAFGCLQVLLDTAAFAAFKLCLLYSNLCCLQALIAIQQPLPA